MYLMTIVVDHFRRRLEGTEKGLEHIPVVGLLAGWFIVCFIHSRLSCYFLKPSFLCIENLSYQKQIFWFVQQKLSSLLQEHRRGILTCQDHKAEAAMRYGS